MFQEISKILKSIKKGVVIVEDGKPAYVLVPFDDYNKQTGKEKDLEGVEFYGSEDACEHEKLFQSLPIDDISPIQNMLDYEFTANKFKPENYRAKKEELVLEGKDIHLEDLPF